MSEFVSDCLSNLVANVCCALAATGFWALLSRTLKKENGLLLFGY
jgi:hypothetical protein